jgi:hypothetical protein
MLSVLRDEGELHLDSQDETGEIVQTAKRKNPIEPIEKEEGLASHIDSIP